MSCVLYVMRADKPVFSSPSLLAAQKFALQKELPLAVVYCLPKPKPAEAAAAFKDFYKIEFELSQVNIPLMILLGDTKKRLNGVFYHLKPEKVYYEEVLAPTEQAPRAHPHKWPGTIMSVKELETLASGTDAFC